MKPRSSALFTPAGGMEAENKGSGSLQQSGHVTPTIDIQEQMKNTEGRQRIYWTIRVSEEENQGKERE